MIRMRYNIKKEWKTFFPNIVLGFNDALIGLTGALVGFSFALREPKLIVIAGLVTGLSASMSMAASAYQQARYEKGRNPIKAASFTGVSYFIVTLLLVLPFVWGSSIVVALMLMSVLVVLMIAGVSFYSALLLKRRFMTQCAEMCLCSLGVASVTFMLGQALGAISTV